MLMGMKRMLATLAASAVLWGCGGAHPPREGSRCTFLPPPISYKHKEVEGRRIFYRESGDPGVQDFGAPVGFRMMAEDPGKIRALIIQNANAYLDGLTPQRQEFFRTAQTDTSRAKYEFLYGLTGKEAVIGKQYLFDLDSADFDTQSPDAWTHDLAFLESQNDRRRGPFRCGRENGGNGRLCTFGFYG
jgi:hypothetical protein